MNRTYHIPSDGLTLVAETTGEGPPLVFSHGLTNNRLQGHLLLQPLIGAYQLVVFDQRGHGESTPVTDPACYDPEHMTNDIVAVMDALGIGRATLSGESMGSATALLFALHHPERVERLWLVAPALADRPNLGSDYIKGLGRQLSTAQGVEDYIRDAMAGGWQEAGYTPEAMACQAAYFRSFQPASMAVACRAVADWAPEKPGRAARHHLPRAHHRVGGRPDPSGPVGPGHGRQAAPRPSDGRGFRCGYPQ